MPAATQLFERLQTWAQRFPDRVAHRNADAALTYTGLLTRARAVAAHLRAVLPDDGSPVIVLGHKEPGMLAGFLGAVGSGHPCIPVDDSLPAQRVERIASLAGATVTLTPSHIAALPDAADGKGELVAPHAAQPFYIIFTSGSTGEPKGVIITAGCLDAFLDWMLTEHAFVEGGETFLNQAPFSFDLSVMDLYLSLATGGTLHSITRDEVADFRRLYRSLSGAGLTAWVSTPSFAQLCLAEKTFDATRLPALRRFLFCGETLLPETAARLLERFPSAEVWNTYGPTEATVATTSIRITPEILAHGGSLPIGFERPGTRVHLVDENDEDPPEGERGQLIIAGPNVSPGYLNAPALTARAFFDSPHGRAYRTGDWGRVRAGMLYFEGRQDHQIKLHGYRIELADIESNLQALPGVRDGVVVPVVRQDAVQFLAAFVVLSAELPPESTPHAIADGIRAALAERLPAYMLPRKIYLRPSLPITANGKADRRQLAELAANGNRPPTP